MYVKNVTYKQKIPFFLHSLHLFLPVKLPVFFATETCWTMYAL